MDLRDSSDQARFREDLRAWRSGSADAQLAIETRDLHKSFGTFEVLSGMNLKIPRGTSTVVLGPSGTGKSVLLKHVLGLLRADRGEVLVNDRPLSRMSQSEILALRRNVGVMFQDGALFSSMNVFENVAFPLRQHTNLTEHEIRPLVYEQLAAVGLQDAASKAPDELSGGMRKRAGLARALVLKPDILLCDEPDSGLDPVRTVLLGELLNARHEDIGGTILTVTHNMALARVIADYVALVWNGTIAIEGPADEVFASEDPFVRQFLAGETAGPLGMD